MGDVGETDEWATVETVSDENPITDHVQTDGVRAEVVHTSLLEQVLGILADYGWFIIIFVAVVYFVYQKLKPKLGEITARQESADHHKNPDLFIARQEAMEAARRRMQEMYDAQAAAHAEKLKEKEEMQRKQKLEDWERHKQGLGYRSKTRVVEDNSEAAGFQPKPKSSKPKLRPEYNPLMGDSGGACFRSARRNVGGG